MRSTEQPTGVVIDVPDDVLARAWRRARAFLIALVFVAAPPLVAGAIEARLQWVVDQVAGAVWESASTADPAE